MNHMTMTETESPTAVPQAPLQGIRVLDLSAYIAGPYGCALLADLGAEVIKSSHPPATTSASIPPLWTKKAAPSSGSPSNAESFWISEARRLDTLMQLVAKADVFVHNFRPNVPPRLKIDFETLSAHNPRLIYCAVSGYGEQGPAREKAGYDQVLQAMSGLCALQGAPGAPEILYGSVVDYYAASILSSGVSSALFQRERTGKGCYVGVSLLRSALAMQSARLVWAESEDRDVNRDMRSGGITGLHPTREGTLYISANTPHFWQALCELTGLDELFTDPRFDTVRKRAENAEFLTARLHEALALRSAEEWQERFGQRVPCAVVRQVEDMFDDPQVAAEGMISNFEHPVIGHYRGFAGAVKFASDSRALPAPVAGTPAPLFGQHTDDILSELGLDPEAIEALHKTGAVE
ncbi:CaiB/BaiF CoA transferase family protein [Salipiger bermudensis]|nr:CoA transferase [Salipiger bermudensis]